MRTTFSSGEIAVVNPRRVNSENSKLAAVLEAKWKKKKKKIKRRVGSRLHNDSSVRVFMGGRNVGKDIPARGMGATTGQSEGDQDGKQGNCPSSELYSTTSNGFQDPLQRRSFFTSWIWIVLHGSRTGTLVLRTIRLFID